MIFDLNGFKEWKEKNFWKMFKKIDKEFLEKIKEKRCSDEIHAKR